MIVKGWDAPYEEPVPWHATLYSHEDGKWNFFCGGTLINEKVVLSAGHCVWKTNPETIRVKFLTIENLKKKTCFRNKEKCIAIYRFC